MRKYLSYQIGKTLELSQVLINRLSETKVFMSTFVWMTVDNIRFTMSNTDKKTNGKLSKPVVWWELREFHRFQLHLSFNYFGFAFVSPEERKVFFLLWKNLSEFECRIFFFGEKNETLKVRLTFFSRSYSAVERGFDFIRLRFGSFAKV